jgi:uncharacterized protein YlxW (UPF0749 family)
MSKIIDSLRRAENIKNGGKSPQTVIKSVAAEPGGSIISTAQNSGQVQAPVSALKEQPLRRTDALPISAKTQDAPTKTIRIAIAIIALAFILLLAANVRLIFLLKNYTRTSSSNSPKLGRLEELIDKNLASLSSRVKDQDAEIKKLNQGVKDRQEQINQLDKDSVAQRTSLENLNKAKKTLFNKVAELEQGLEKLQNPAPAQPKQ